MSIRKGNTIIAGNIDAVYETDEQTITIDRNEKLQVIGTINKNNSLPKYDWVGTKAEYDALEEKNEDWLYFVTDDEKETVTLANCVGQIIQAVCTSSYIPNGCIPCDGTEYTADRFLDFWTNYLTSQPAKILTCTYNEYATDITTYGQCAKFAIDTSSQKFKAPTIKNGSVIQQAMSDSELGKSYNAGLPNITGTFNTRRDNTANTLGTSGAFAPEKYGNSDSFFYGNDNTSNGFKVSIDASRSSAVYGNSSTVQPNAVALRYFVVVVDTYLNQSQLDWTTYTQSLNNKADKNLVNTGLITNCITEIPQDIKLELNNGVLTLKAGSKVYVPNGFKEDGVTPHFDTVITSVDNSNSTTGDGSMLMSYNPGNSHFYAGYVTGSTVQTKPQSPINHATYYITSTNTCEYYDPNSTSWHKVSLPISISTRTNTGFTSINQVFNGFGYIGSTVFALPGIKGLAPNGRNSDGSLKNLEFTINSVKINTRTDDRANTLVLSGNEISQQIFPTSWNYDAEKNIVYNVSANSQRNYCVVGQVSSESTKITSFQPKTTLHAVDYSGADFVIAYKRPTSTDPTWYRLYKSGWVEQGGDDARAGTAVSLPIKMSDTYYYASCLSKTYNDSQAVEMHIKERTTTTVLFSCAYNGSSNYTSEICLWEVKGFSAGY